MSSFDPNEVREAVSAFTPKHPLKFENLMPAREVIAELRRKRASYRAIAELLTQHCLPTGKTAVADFCHEVLGETIRSRHRTPRKRHPNPEPGLETNFVPSMPATAPPAEPGANNDTAEVQPARTRGPRIAQIRRLHSPTHEKTDSHP